MLRLDRGIQYAAAYRFNRNRLWNTGLPAFAGNDTACLGRTHPFPANSVGVRPVTWRNAAEKAGTLA